MILKRLALALLLISGAALIGALFVAPALAVGLTKGSTVLSFQLARGDGDFATPAALNQPATGYITAFDHTEWGGQVQMQHLVSEAWALAISAGVGTSSETDEPGPAALPGSFKREFSNSSWNVRLGFDRFAHISPEFHLYAGPGIQFWSGKAKFENGPSSIESEPTTRIALSGRMGAHVALSESVGLNGHLGGYIGRASADDAGAEATWSPTGNEGAVGLAFKF
jgi:hypothetical protein